MVKFYSSTEQYPYPFPAVTLAYFLRYPNPYSTHVLSTDTIARSFDPETQRLTTIRLHLKRSKLPGAVLKLLPRSLLGASATGDTQSFILEKSVVDVKEGWMDTESRNLEWTGVLSVVERQKFMRPNPAIPDEAKIWQGMEGAARRHGFLNFGIVTLARHGRRSARLRAKVPSKTINHRRSASCAVGAPRPCSAILRRSVSLVRSEASPTHERA
jgi:4-amino-4-deoxychorismate lyase